MDTRQLLIMQRNSLVEALPGAESFAQVRANRLIRRIDYRLGFSDDTLELLRGKFGENGWAPEVERAVSLLQYRPSPSLSRRAGERWRERRNGGQHEQA